MIGWAGLCVFSGSLQACLPTRRITTAPQGRVASRSLHLMRNLTFWCPTAPLLSLWIRITSSNWSRVRRKSQWWVLQSFCLRSCLAPVWSTQSKPAKTWPAPGASPMSFTTGRNTKTSTSAFTLLEESDAQKVYMHRQLHICTNNITTAAYLLPFSSEIFHSMCLNWVGLFFSYLLQVSCRHEGHPQETNRNHIILLTIMSFLIPCSRDFLIPQNRHKCSPIGLGCIIFQCLFLLWYWLILKCNDLQADCFREILA